VTRHKGVPTPRRPWIAALIAVVLVTAVSLALQSRLPFVDAPGGLPTLVDNSAADDAPEIVASTAFSRIQEVLPAPPAFHKAPKSPDPRRPELPNVTCVPGSDTTLRVVTFNIHSGLGPRGLNLEQVAREIESWDPDVVLLQEVDLFRRHSQGIDEAAWFGSRLGMSHSSGMNSSFGGRAQIGNATLSRFPIVEEANTYLPNQPGLPNAVRRGLLRTSIEVGESVVSIYNTHLQPAYERLKLSQMQAVVRSLAADPDPKILGGDFNAVASSQVMGVARPFLTDVWDVVGAGPDGTSPGAHRARIDHLLYSSPLVPEEARTIESAVSDHRAVGATFTLPGDGEVCVPVLEEDVSGSGN
jgi:endonuclease/exonuclease/phosphatase family metal-dependent hydrolase